MTEEWKGLVAESSGGRQGWMVREQRWKAVHGGEDVSWQVGIGDPNGTDWRTLTTLYDQEAATMIVRDHNLMLPVLNLLWHQKTGSCWCPCGIDNPNMRGVHDTFCTLIQGLFQALRTWGIEFPLDN